MARKRNKRAPKNKDGVMSVADECELYRKILPPERHAISAPVTLVIDGMSVAHTAYHAYNRLSYKGKSVSMIFGVPKMIAGYIKRYKPAKVVVCWDGMKSARRMKWLPEYKMHRMKTRDEVKRAKFDKEIQRVRYILNKIGIAQAHNEMVEGDDMVCLITQRESKLSKVIVVSGDKDMLQLVNWDVKVLNPRTNQLKVCDIFSLGEPFIRVDQVVDYIAMVGDSSDDIPGIKGIGPSKAIAFLRKYGSFKAYYNDDDAMYTGMMDKDKAYKIMKRNRKMIDIIWYCNKYHKKSRWITYYKDQPFPQWNEDKYRNFCTKWNLRTMLTQTFMDIFKTL